MKFARIAPVPAWIVSGLILTVYALPSLAAADDAPRPEHIVVDASLPAAQRDRQIDAALRYYRFWNKGDASDALAALAPDFIDTNLPAGRAQGPGGPLQAAAVFRRAVPDLRLKVEEMIVAGDRVVGRLHFSGHFSGRFGQRQGDGRAIDFRAVDIYTIKSGRIAENWHLEDNLSLLRQLGVVAD
ncbi:ester cyclase [Paludibacterium yongneupense]|uniref:ester cyclase n=1 Tax=Paludibacterium yongneupense TaxID=400061 RepID=UPI0003FF88EE|nr:ester cyclase [Paludibacterium yongneupense]